MEMQAWRDAWTRAEAACNALREALEFLGFPEPVRAAIRPQVHYRGTAQVHVGVIDAGRVEELAAALRRSVELRPPAR
ncbi:hypothetical protein [Streptomyces sp. NBC_00212]|uniref:hypothetical protein n=1 Tax=Streptomyces sp. NBC_00212 TaxID=2975684 RepID=UPI00324313B6